MQKNRPEIRFEGFDDGWEQRKLGDIFKYEQPQAYIVESTEYDDKNDIPVLTAGQSFILGYTDERFGIKEANEENPVIIFDDFTTSSHYVDFPFKIKSSAMKLLTLNNPKDDIHCTFNVLQNIGYVPVSHERHWISTFAKFNVLLPKSSSEQTQIGSYFRNLDNLITLHQRKCDRLQALKKAMLEKMFPKAGSDVPEIRFAGFTDAWEQRKLGDMMNVTSVKRIHQSDWTDSGVRFLRARDIVAAAKNEEPDDYLYISKEKYEEYSALSGKVGVSDLLVTGVGTIGVPYLVRNLEPLYFKDGNIIWFQNSDKIDGKFLFYSFSAEQIQGFINESAGIGTVGTYTIESGKKTPISLPNQIEQAKVGDFFQQLDNLITLHQRKLQKLQECKKALLEKMFVG